MRYVQFYNYDCSEWLPIRFGPSGMISLRSKSVYPADSTTTAYLILCDGEPAGVATVDNEIHSSDAGFNIGSFFVARRFKRKGICRETAAELFRRSPWKWQVWHPVANIGAERFWSKTIPELATSEVHRRELDIDGGAATLYQFEAGRFQLM